MERLEEGKMGSHYGNVIEIREVAGSLWGSSWGGVSLGSHTEGSAWLCVVRKIRSLVSR